MIVDIDVDKMNVDIYADKMNADIDVDKMNVDIAPKQNVYMSSNAIKSNLSVSLKICRIEVVQDNSHILL